MVLDVVAGRRDGAAQMRMASCTLADAEEGRLGAVSRQDLEHLRCHGGIRSVIDSDRDLAARAGGLR